MVIPLSVTNVIDLYQSKLRMAGSNKNNALIFSKYIRNILGYS